MAFPPEFLDELRNRITTSEVVGKRVKLVKKGREFSGLCRIPRFAPCERDGP